MIPTPRWIRLPKPGTQCAYTGLARSVLNRLILPGAENRFSPPVRSIVLKKPGTTRGVRLVNFDDLIGYLRKLEAAQNPSSSDQTIS